MRVVLLDGGAETSSGDLSPTSMPSAHAQLVFTMLAVEAPRTVRPGEIADAMWGDRLPKTWETIVRQSIGRTRRWLDEAGVDGHSIVQSANGGYRLVLPADWTTDLATARHAVAEAEVGLVDDPARALGFAAEAVRWIDGRELLPLAEGDWVQGVRSTIDSLAVRAHEVAVDAAERLGDHRRAVDHARRLTTIEPFREPFHRRLMAALAAAGDRSGALRAYDDLFEMFAAEIGVAPSPETVHLHESLRSSPMSTPAPERRQPDPWSTANLDQVGFVGRDADAERLAAHWRQATQGRLTISVVSGEAGIGKTTLALHAAHRVWTAGATVLVGRCTARPSMPYEPIVDAIASHLASSGDKVGRALIDRAGPALAHALPSVGDVGGVPMATSDVDHDRLRLFDAMTSFIDAVTASGPTMLILDDVQWASEATWQLVVHLVHRLATAPLHIVMSQRSPEASAGPILRFLADLRRHPGIDEIVLAGWTNAEAEAYLAGASTADAARAESLRLRTGGNPFFITQLVRAEMDGGTLRDRGETDIPQGILDVVRHHQATGGDDASLVLQALAIAGPTAAPWSWRRATGLGDDRFADGVDAALRTGLIRERPSGGGRFEFTHALARDAVAVDIPPGHRRRLHLTLADELEQRRTAGEDVSLADLAHHHAAAAPLSTVDQVVSSGLLAARAELAVGARDEAAARMAAILPMASTSQQRIDALLLLATAQMQLGNADVARRSFLDAAALARSIGDGPSLGRAAIGLTNGGRGASGWVADAERVELLEAALAMVDGNDDRLQVQLLGALAATSTGPDSWPRRQSLADRALAIAARSTDPQVVIASIGASRHSLWRPDQTEQRLAAADRALAVAERLGADEVSADAALLRLADLVVLGDRSAVDDALEFAAAVIDRLGMIRHRWELQLWRAGLALSDGRFADATSAASGAFAMWDTDDQPDARRAAAEFAAMTLLMVQDTPGIAAAMPGLAEASDTIGTYRCAQACALAVVGRLDEASALLTEISRDGYAVVPHHSSWMFAMAMLAEAAAIAGSPEVIAELRVALAPQVGRIVLLEGPNVPWGAVDHHLGLLCLAAGDTVEARRHLGAAVVLHDRFGADIWRRRTDEALRRLDEVEAAAAG